MLYPPPPPLSLFPASEMKRCDKIGELMEERQEKDRREQNKVPSGD
jgi:hypothetical protein